MCAAWALGRGAVGGSGRLRADAGDLRLPGTSPTGADPPDPRTRWWSARSRAR